MTLHDLIVKIFMKFSCFCLPSSSSIVLGCCMMIWHYLLWGLSFILWANNVYLVMLVRRGCFVHINYVVGIGYQESEIFQQSSDSDSAERKYDFVQYLFISENLSTDNFNQFRHSFEAVSQHFCALTIKKNLHLLTSGS